jgi:predicted nucleic acid-binding protein
VAECLRVLAYPHIAKTLAPKRRQKYARQVVAGLAAGADMVSPEMLPKLRVVKADPDDDLFLATALAGGAQVLVSGDRRHLLSMREYAGVRIIDTAAFLAELEQPETDG